MFVRISLWEWLHVLKEWKEEKSEITTLRNGKRRISRGKTEKRIKDITTERYFKWMKEKSLQRQNGWSLTHNLFNYKIVRKKALDRNLNPLYYISIFVVVLVIIISFFLTFFFFFCLSAKKETYTYPTPPAGSQYLSFHFLFFFSYNLPRNQKTYVCIWNIVHNYTPSLYESILISIWILYTNL